MSLSAHLKATVQPPHLLSNIPEELKLEESFDRLYQHDIPVALEALHTALEKALDANTKKPHASFPVYKWLKEKSLPFINYFVTETDGQFSGTDPLARYKSEVEDELKNQWKAVCSQFPEAKGKDERKARLYAKLIDLYKIIMVLKLDINKKLKILKFIYETEKQYPIAELRREFSAIKARINRFKNAIQNKQQEIDDQLASFNVKTILDNDPQLKVFNAAVEENLQQHLRSFAEKRAEIAAHETPDAQLRATEKEIRRLKSKQTVIDIDVEEVKFSDKSQLTSELDSKFSELADLEARRERESKKEATLQFRFAQLLEKTEKLDESFTAALRLIREKFSQIANTDGIIDSFDGLAKSQTDAPKSVSPWYHLETQLAALKKHLAELQKISLRLHVTPVCEQVLLGKAEEANQLFEEMKQIASELRASKNKTDQQRQKYTRLADEISRNLGPAFQTRQTQAIKTARDELQQKKSEQIAYLTAEQARLKQEIKERKSPKTIPVSAPEEAKAISPAASSQPSDLPSPKNAPLSTPEKKESFFKKYGKYFKGGFFGLVGGGSIGVTVAAFAFNVAVFTTIVSNPIGWGIGLGCGMLVSVVGLGRMGRSYYKERKLFKKMTEAEKPTFKEMYKNLKEKGYSNSTLRLMMKLQLTPQQPSADARPGETVYAIGRTNHQEYKNAPQIVAFESTNQLYFKSKNATGVVVEPITTTSKKEFRARMQEFTRRNGPK